MYEDRTILSKNIHKPQTCEKCGAPEPEYKGVGEYKCKECGHVMYDDFGVVRNYLEVHKGATQSDVHRGTGVAMDTIRLFLKEERLEIAPGSGVMMACEICGAAIRSGRYCSACSKAIEMRRESEKSSGHKSGMHGFGLGPKGESGAKRFTR